MSQLVTTDRQPAAVAEPQQPRSRAIGEGLASAESALIIDTKADRPWTDETYLEICRLTDPYGLGWRSGRERCERALAIAPEMGSLEAYIRRLETVATAAPDQRTTRYLIGLLVSSFPHGRPADLDVYCETLLHDAMSLGFSPPVVAGACRTLRRTVRFLPAVAEFVEACGTQRKGIEGPLYAAKNLRKRIEQAKEWIAKDQGDGLTPFEGK